MPVGRTNYTLQTLAKGFAVLESGCGWVPFCKKTPRERVTEPQCFFACDPDESSIKPFLDVMGEDRVIYASDYPHWDGKFPGTVDMIADRTELTDVRKAKVLRAHGRRLFTRLA